jgi:hypothetical protein
MTKRTSALSKRWKQQAKKKKAPQAPAQPALWLLASLAALLVGVLVVLLVSRTQPINSNPNALPTAAIVETVDPSLNLLTPPVTYFAIRTVAAYTCPGPGCSIAYPVQRGGSVVIDAIKDGVWGRIQGQEAYVKMDVLTRTDINQPLPTYPPAQVAPANNNSEPPRPTGPDRDCASFGSHNEAQAFFLAAGGPGSDPHQLDGDSDGIACERLR